jgi:hypothetical protein
MYLAPSSCVYMYIYARVSYDTVNPVCVYACLINTLTVCVCVWQPLAARTYSLAWGNVIPVKDGERVSVYISQPVPCR